MGPRIALVPTPMKESRNSLSPFRHPCLEDGGCAFHCACRRAKLRNRLPGRAEWRNATRRIRAVAKTNFRIETSKPLTRPSATLSPSDGERAGVRGHFGNELRQSV